VASWLLWLSFCLSEGRIYRGEVQLACWRHWYIGRDLSLSSLCKAMLSTDLLCRVYGGAGHAKDVFRHSYLQMVSHARFEFEGGNGGERLQRLRVKNIDGERLAFVLCLSSFKADGRAISQKSSNAYLDFRALLRARLSRGTTLECKRPTTHDGGDVRIVVGRQ
jgi:hypothetical protein